MLLTERIEFMELLVHRRNKTRNRNGNRRQMRRARVLDKTRFNENDGFFVKFGQINVDNYI